MNLEVVIEQGLLWNAVQRKLIQCNGKIEFSNNFIAVIIGEKRIEIQKFNVAPFMVNPLNCAELEQILAM